MVITFFNNEVTRSPDSYVILNNSCNKFQLAHHYMICVNVVKLDLFIVLLNYIKTYLSRNNSYTRRRFLIHPDFSGFIRNDTSFLVRVGVLKKSIFFITPLNPPGGTY
jgi:hypothetical protein